MSKYVMTVAYEYYTETYSSDKILVFMVIIGALCIWCYTTAPSSDNWILSIAARTPDEM